MPVLILALVSTRYLPCSCNNTFTVLILIDPYLTGSVIGTLPN